MEKACGRNNAHSLFQIQRIPCDNHIRQTLDPIEASHLFSLLDDLHKAFAQTGVLEAMRAVKHTRLIALDATWYFSSQSQNIHCPNCSCIRHTEGQITHFHSAITPVIVSPGHSQVVPLCPEFITPQDGQLKQDCEINAAKRWLAAHAQHYSTGNDTLLGALKVNWCEVTITNGQGAVLYRNAFITDWEITAENVSGLVAAGRARWKIENESNNVLKTKGYHLEHNFGHGKEHLSSLLMTMNLLAFALHTLLELTDTSYQLVRAAVGARRKFFEHLEALIAYWFFENWEQLMDFMMRGQEVGPYALQKN